MDPKWLIVKVVARKGRSDMPYTTVGWTGLVSHHLGSLLGAIEFTVLCAFICTVGYLDVHIREILIYK